MVDPDLPTTEEEYAAMKARAQEYGTGTLADLQREDRAFLIYEVTKYELIHAMKLTFSQRFRRRELAWWQAQ